MFDFNLSYEFVKIKFDGFVKILLSDCAEGDSFWKHI